jgi:hypothetical protein
MMRNWATVAGHLATNLILKRNKFFPETFNTNQPVPSPLILYFFQNPNSKFSAALVFRQKFPLRWRTSIKSSRRNYDIEIYSHAAPVTSPRFASDVTAKEIRCMTFSE